MCFAHDAGEKDHNVNDAHACSWGQQEVRRIARYSYTFSDDFQASIYTVGTHSNEHILEHHAQQHTATG